MSAFFIFGVYKMVENDIDQFVWTEKYRPKTIEECILPNNIKQTFLSFIQNKSFPNLLMTGSAGVGKTTAAKALLNELQCDYIVINASMNGNIDTLRTEIKNFASTVSFTNSRKYVILDEADHLTAATQPALRNFMEEYSNNCGFILTCNFINRVIEPLRSRCSIIEFKIDKEESAIIASKFFKRVIKILENEGVEYNKETVVALITKYFPDWRRVINELQSYAINGNIINSGILTAKNNDIKNIIQLLKNKNFSDIRTYVAENIDNLQSIYTDLYDNLQDSIKTNTIPELIVILAKYQYQSAFVASQEINIAACLAEIMVNIEFK